MTLSAAFFRLTDYPVEDAAHVPSEDLKVGGRVLHVPKALKGVAVFSFNGCAARRAARRTIWRSRGASTPSSWSASPSWGPRIATRRRASSS